MRQLDGGYELSTSRGPWRCRKLVIASGACNLASIPSLSAGLPAKVDSLTPLQFRNPGLLTDGGVMVVGASASGIQLAREIRATGRQVVLSVGEHVRMPRTYRGRDIQWWLDAIGAMDVRYDAIEDIERARRLPSPGSTYPCSIAKGASATMVAWSSRGGCMSWACRSCADASRLSSTGPAMMQRISPLT